MQSTGASFTLMTSFMNAIYLAIPARLVCAAHIYTSNLRPFSSQKYTLCNSWMVVREADRISRSLPRLCARPNEAYAYWRGKTEGLYIEFH